MEKTIKPMLIDTFQAGANLTNKNRFVRLTSGKVVLCGANAKAIGVIAEIADENEYVGVIMEGVVLLEVGTGGLTEGDLVASAANGLAVAAAAVTVTVPTGATPVTSDAAQPTLVVAGGALPTKINGIALETVAEGGFARVKLA